MALIGTNNGHEAMGTGCFEVCGVRDGEAVKENPLPEDENVL